VDDDRSAVGVGAPDERFVASLDSAGALDLSSEASLDLGGQRVIHALGGGGDGARRPRVSVVTNALRLRRFSVIRDGEGHRAPVGEAEAPVEAERETVPA
jgi:hypothetical protein